jgi:exo-beta-1,3-glucanase (GH17 family)
VETVEARLLLSAGVVPPRAALATAQLRAVVAGTVLLRQAPWSPYVTAVERGPAGTTVTFQLPNQAPIVEVLGEPVEVVVSIPVGIGRTALTITASNAAGQAVSTVRQVARVPIPQSPRVAASFVGLSYQPYVKQWTAQKTVPAFNSYGSGNASVANQLALIAPFYNKVATYSAGYAGYYPVTQPYNKLDSNWQVASAAAQLNKAQGKSVMTVAQGIYQQTNPDGTINSAKMNAEISDAFQIVSNANSIHPKTVNRLIFTNEYATSASTTAAVDAMVNANKAKAHAMGLQVGVRSQTFGQLTNPSSPYLAQMRQLVKDCDFIMLNLYPSADSVKQGVAAALKNVTDEFQRIKAAALKVNPSIVVLMGETGWPSQGIAFNDLSGKTSTVANEKAYLAAFTQWANANKVESYPFEAIDEPWKSNQNQTSGDPWQGPNGAEGHYGIWTYSTSNDTGKFTPKWPQA